MVLPFRALFWLYGLRLRVKDSALINDQEIKKLTSGVLKTGKTSVQVIVGPQVAFVADEMKRVTGK